MSDFSHQSSPPSISFLIPHAGSYQVGGLTHSSSSSDSHGDVFLPELLSYECISSFGSDMDVFYSNAMLDSPLPALEAQLGGVNTTRRQTSMGRKRREIESCGTNSAQVKCCRVSNAKKKMRQNNRENGPREAERKIASQFVEENEPVESHTEYIHVRARRGQATDSHSIAERVRREKISERMKLLQGLVPGCDNVIGKAHMLDEIINYVQSLHNQVEFLSMKLASINPMLLEFGPDFDECMFQEPASMPALEQFQKLPHITSKNTMLENPSTFSLDEEGSTTLTQENESFVMQLADHHQAFLDQNQHSSPQY